jgi:hypothetical protein
MCELRETNSPLDKRLAAGKVSPKEWAEKKREEIAKEVKTSYSGKTTTQSYDTERKR